jgi:hypothetical protein
MISFLDWEGYVPDDIPEDEWWRWIKDNVDGGEFNDSGVGDWIWETDVELLEDETS